MPANLCITPDLGKEDMDPEVSTRMIILSSKANVSESEGGCELRIQMGDRIQSYHRL